MRITRRTFMAATAAASAAPSWASESTIDSYEAAASHRISRQVPTPSFFEGMILGNGDLGVCITLRPDGLGLHIGKEDSWDIRVSEEHARSVVPFAQVMEMWGRASERAKQAGKPEATYLEQSDPELRAYCEKVSASYGRQWPRPWPCGTVWIHWDSRWVRLLRQTLNVANGCYTADLELAECAQPKRRVTLECFVSRNRNHVIVTCDNPSPVLSVAYYPNVDGKAMLPMPELAATASEFSCFQRFPATAPSAENPQPAATPQDANFALHACLSGTWKSSVETSRRVLLTTPQSQTFRLDIALFTRRDDRDSVERAGAEARGVSAVPAAALKGDTESAWREFWSKSAVRFEDKELERIWYHNQYWLACCLKPGAVAPGLFGNWSSGEIGTAWHGDYHMNYNTQQVYWGVFSSNHAEQHLPYVELVEKLMPMALRNAHEQFGLPGAYFPHSAYPVPSHVNPYPVPPWGYEICETPWTVQSLWWHYLYTRDDDYLRRVYPMLRAAAEFIEAYAKQGPDGRYHANPSVSPENWGLTVDQRLNRDCIIDIALIEFLFDAVLEASEILGTDGSRRERWATIRRALAPYPTGEGRCGKVWLDVAGAPAEWVYNVPVTTAPVFPAEQVGLDRRVELLDLAARTVESVRLEGGNDLVWLPLVRARLGLLDLDWFKREVQYCTLPNGIANDRVRQSGGRYTDGTDFDFMMRMGVWTENLSLPAVLNECMLQSYAGIIRLFPNRRGLGAAQFDRLRAVGAFLVSAKWNGSEINDVRISSEKGLTVRLANPWPGKAVVVQDGRSVVPTSIARDIISFDTKAGAEYAVARKP